MNLWHVVVYEAPCNRAVYTNLNCHSRWTFWMLANTSVQLCCRLQLWDIFPHFTPLPLQGPQCFAITMVNTAVKMESSLENGIHLRKWNFTEEVIFLPITLVNLHKYHTKNTISEKKMRVLLRKRILYFSKYNFQISVQNNKIWLSLDSLM